MRAEEILAKFPPQHTVKDVVAARKWLMDPEVKALPYNGVFAAFKRGELAKECRIGPCHGSMSGVGPSGTLTATQTKHVAYFGKVTLVKDKPEVAKRWFQWLVKDGYFSPFWSNTTVEDALDNGLLISNLLPANLVQGCLINCRHQHEKPTMVEMWDDLVTAGVNPDVAYLMVFGLGLNKTSITQGGYCMMLAPAHNAITHLTPTMVPGFLNRDYNNLLEPFYDGKKDSQAYGQSSQIPYPQGTVGAAHYYNTDPSMIRFAEFVSDLGTVKTAAKKIASPFGTAANTQVQKLYGTHTPAPRAELFLKFAKEIENYITKEFISEK